MEGDFQVLLSISSQSKWQQRTESEFLWYGIFLPLFSCVMQFLSLFPHACLLPRVLLLNAKGLSQTRFAMHLNIVLSWPKIAGQQRFVGLQKSSTHGGIISFYSLSHTEKYLVCCLDPLCMLAFLLTFG